MPITATTLRTWSERLCTLPALDLGAAVTALELPGAVVVKGPDHARLDPPPPGTSLFELTLETLGDNRGKLAYVDLTLAGAPIARRDLDREFGESTTMPRLGHDGAASRSYWLWLPDAPFRVTLVARFAGDAATEITLRRDAVKPAAGREPRT